ncbi:conserved hypothetical protein [Segniliparus rotundus DSM 44985]|uniref:Uncharacterized protein n=1 Tax=Segniliparus rotundus (strain ATCC BAA-972 / CDC 1076 / CIP 108378 / DSM 44985 / JCM 13578) TaxID=640132 RepID=D6ZB59_SEGRD|nr:hypothetical protein [Segniliparus rotundus]ADG96818.1 conserved hypothetical protein [Segniliparus rotundus DSM 44985]
MSISARAVAARCAAAAALASAALIASPPANAEGLNGLFSIAPGSCVGSPQGSYFRMILPAGGEDGPFLGNSDSPCGDNTVTPLAPGTDGGLITGKYQPQPAAPFARNGDATAGTVTRPVRFYGVLFATSTNQTDPQTKEQTALPVINRDGNTLSGDLSAFAVTWNNQVFNQGAPKPGGDLPGHTTPVKGVIDTNGNYTLTWTSQIVSGPFDGFTGLWHLQGHFGGSR